MYIKLSFLRGVQKFVEAPDMRRDCIGCKWLSANSLTPSYFSKYKKYDYIIEIKK